MEVMRILGALDTLFLEVRDKLDRSNQDVEDEYPFANIEGQSVPALGVRNLLNQPVP
jgi:hypothetical protein